MANRSDSIANIGAALMEALHEIGAAGLDTKNSFNNSRYASLGSVIEVIRPILKKNGLSYIQLDYGGVDAELGQVTIHRFENKELAETVLAPTAVVGVTTLIMHTSGEWIEASVSLPLLPEKGKTQIQAAGSTFTYLRRYGLSAAFGVYAEDEDGATTGQARQQGQNRQQNQTRQPAGTTGRPNDAKVTPPAEEKATAATPEPTPGKVELTLEQAMSVTTAKGTKLGTLSINQLRQLIDLNGLNPITKQAAQVCLASLEGKLEEVKSKV